MALLWWATLWCKKFARKFAVFLPAHPARLAPTSKLLRDVGITITKEGKMELDATKAETALASQFDDMVKMLSQNRTVHRPRSKPCPLAWQVMLSKRWMT
jgi:hypothetical protein